MPPKARGRGGGRGRATGRGGPDSAQPVADMQLTDTQATTPPSETSVMPRQEGGGQEAIAESTVSNSVENQNPSSVTSSSSTPLNEPTTRPPTLRLSTLRSTEPLSRSASPAVRRGASSRGKKSQVALPTNAGRRSKEERDARNAADLQRERERNRERDNLAEKKQKAIEAAERRAQQRAVGRGRGGFSGVSSFFGGPSRSDKRSAHPDHTFGGSGSRASRVKDEFDESRLRFKREGNGYVPSDDDDEENAEFPRKDIEFIDLSIEDDDAEARGDQRAYANLPVRIRREEHKERKISMNPEAVVQTNVKKTGQGEVPVRYAGSETLHKGKGKAKDVEITGERKPYKGMWQDSDDAQVNIKVEPVSSDDETEAKEQVGIGATSTRGEQSLGRERKTKTADRNVPEFGTEEEREEWERIQHNLKAMTAELGPVEEEQPMIDTGGDVLMADTSADNSRPSIRDDHVYLFQLPPIMPELHTAGIKKEQHAATTDSPALVRAEVGIKKEEEEFSDPRGKTPAGPRFVNGCVGKLRVHRSGRTTLDWGGTSYLLGPGTPGQFLQEVASLNITPVDKRDPPEDAGEAFSYGRIKEKFVVTPNFIDLLG